MSRKDADVIEELLRKIEELRIEVRVLESLINELRGRG